MRQSSTCSLNRHGRCSTVAVWGGHSSRYLVRPLAPPQPITGAQDPKQVWVLDLQYKPEVWYWETVSLLRKVALAIIAVLLATEGLAAGRSAGDTQYCPTGGLSAGTSSLLSTGCSY
jgi:hypothetical protein